MGIRDIYHGPDDDQRPSRLWERLHPRQAEAYWAAEQEKFDLENERIWAEGEAERQTDAKYWKWVDNEYHTGNPPMSAEYDRTIDRFSEQYPEVSALEREQREFEEEAYTRGPNWSYPEQERPGFTEPPLHLTAPREHEGWTFTQWAEERGYDTELIEDINCEFPPDQAEKDYARRRAEAQAEQDFARDWDDYSAWRIEHPLSERQEPEAPGHVRIVPMGKRDGTWESPREREVRGEIDPYSDWTPWSQYWAPGIELER